MSCDYNQFASLDVSKNTALTELSCGSNQLTTLDISKNIALTNLKCSYNPGNGSVFVVKSWFDNNSIPSLLYFSTGNWLFDGRTITIDYQKVI